ncbi:MAG: AAA-like domain-containing protein, partial [Prevotellaceae bacterium]|nr:AAA-like domain-containing protein [Prevotellaceae bacterium]
MKSFNIAGPCNPARHYMIDAATRLKGVEQLIDMEEYFVIHAARQSGKTTYLNELVGHLNAKGQYYALCCSFKGLQEIIDPIDGIPAIVRTIQNKLGDSDIPHKEEFAKDAKFDHYIGVLGLAFTRFCRLLDKPLVVLFDDVDCLSRDTTAAFLSELRVGYNTRVRVPFIHSAALVGIHDVSRFRGPVSPGNTSPAVPVPFNIVTETFTLKNFTQKEIAQLYQQHTDETGQQFEPDAVALVHEQTQGQPWLVNA